MRFVLATALVACSVEPTPVTPTNPPAFVYIEDRDELTFWPPTSLRLVLASKHACRSELSTGNGNMWTGPDIEAALADHDVQAALSRGGTTSFVAAPDLDHAIHVGVVRVGKAAIEWHVQCRWCTAEPAGVRNLHGVLVGVMRNRRATCRVET